MQASAHATSVHPLAARAGLHFGLSGGKPAWIGLSDEVAEGSWQWMDGTPLDFEYWLPGFPNDMNFYDSVYTCGSEGEWCNDFTGTSHKYGVVCKGPPF